MRRCLTIILAAPLFTVPMYALDAQVRHVDLYCHRTANQDVPENTLESLEQAALLGCDVVEVDVRRTLDGRLVLNHDGFLERLTDGQGEIETSFYDDLRLRDMGGWMSDRFRGLHIVLFEEALRLARQHKIRLILDMKDKNMGADVLASLTREGMLDQVEFGGEWDDVKRIYPQANHVNHPQQWVSPGITADQVVAYHREGKSVIVNFSVNGHDMDIAGMKAAVAAGADAINVDFPRLGADAVGRPVESRLHELILRAGSGQSDARTKAILELSRYRGFFLEENFARWLLDANVNVSRAAALGLVMARPMTQPSVFQPALRSGHTAARANAAWALGMLRAPSSMVLPLLRDEDPQVLSKALVALSHMPGTVSAERLLPFLSNKESAVRGAAALALATHQPKAAAKTIPAQLHRDAEQEEAVHRTHDANGGGPYTQAEINVLVKEYRCQMEMLRALHMLSEADATRELEAEAFGVDNAFPEPNGSVAALMLWDHLAADPAAAIRELETGSVQAADRAEWALVHTDDKVLPAVRSSLTSSNAEERMRAIRIVAWRGDVASLQTLHSIEAKHGPDAGLAAWAAERITSLHPVP